MCGIVGLLQRNQPISRELFTELRDSLHHRGPDGGGSEFFQEDRVALGHRRLSIIDLSEDGRQPMTNEDRTLWLTFNGEIYNYQGLKTELVAAGHRFASNTDSEVLLHGYEQWGLGLLDRLEGMFAFALWDDTRQELLLVRDRVGIKPLYWHYDGQRLGFGSELKAIVTHPEVRREVDWQAVSDYLVHRFIPQPRTIWKNIQKLGPGQFLRYSFAEGAPEVKTYWQLKPGQKQVAQAEAVEQAREMLQQSVKEQLMADVPLGVFLSGGYDSSALVMHMADLGVDIQSFAIGFEGWKKSEHGFAREVADTFGTQHHEWVLKEEMTGLAEKLAYHYDEPLGGSSFLPTYLVSQKAREHVKVILSGDGGDEVFAGYDWHQRLMRNWYPQGGLGAQLKGMAKRSLRTMDLPALYQEYTSWAGFDYAMLSQLGDPQLFKEYSGQQPADLYRDRLPKGLGPVKSFQYLDYQTLMSEVFLTKVDRASMANSLEVRVPFLYGPLMEYTMGLDESVYYRQDTTKLLLHHQLKGRVPNSILKKPKKGFGAPRQLFLSRKIVEEALGNGVLLKEGVLQPSAYQAMLEQDKLAQLWAWYILEYWWRTWKPTA